MHTKFQVDPTNIFGVTGIFVKTPRRVRYVEKFGIAYKNYICDGDSKTFAGLLKAAPYGSLEICKKECIAHVQRRMGTRLREIVNKCVETVVKGGRKNKNKNSWWQRQTHWQTD